MNPYATPEYIRSRLAQVRRDGDAEIARQTGAGHGPAVKPAGGAEIMAEPKPLAKSWLNWGALVVAIGTIATLVGNAHQAGQPIPWTEILMALGGLIGVVGGGRKIDRAATK